MTILILSFKEDPHAKAVATALEHKGLTPIICNTEQFPEEQRYYVYLSSDGTQEWTLKRANTSSDLGNIQVVWNRRPSKPRIPAHIHAEDVSFVQQECDSFYEQLWPALLRNAFWINDALAAKRCNSKILQLELAQECGFLIPRTIFSNDPTEINNFIASNKQFGTIYKPLSAPVLCVDQKESLLYTTEVSLETLCGDRMLQITPGIFQEKIPKKYEIRLVIFGNHAEALRIYSQDHPRAQMDWRAFIDDIKVEPQKVSDTLFGRCKLLMSKLGIVFGCFDLIVTPENEIVFLEVNQMGQFLWMEELCPELSLLDSFAEFLIHGNNLFDYKPSKAAFSLADI